MQSTSAPPETVDDTMLEQVATPPVVADPTLPEQYGTGPGAPEGDSATLTISTMP